MLACKQLIDTSYNCDVACSRFLYLFYPKKRALIKKSRVQLLASKKLLQLFLQSFSAELQSILVEHHSVVSDVLALLQGKRHDKVRKTPIFWSNLHYRSNCLSPAACIFDCQ